MVAVWHIYLNEKCRHTTPVKKKYVVVVCANPNPYGFLINSRIHPFVLKKPDLLAGQVLIESNKYSFLNHDSYINCNELFSFRAQELKKLQKVQNNTKTEIKNVVAASKLIEPLYKKLIC